jgi:hypothetical protein
MSNCHEKHKNYKNLVFIFIHDGFCLLGFSLRNEAPMTKIKNDELKSWSLFFGLNDFRHELIAPTPPPSPTSDILLLT